MRNRWKLMNFIICVCAVSLSFWGASCKSKTVSLKDKEVFVSSKFLPNLLISKNDIPLEVVLWELKGLSESNSNQYQEKWHSLLGKHGPNYDVWISVTVAASRKEAKEIAKNESMSVAGIPQYVSGQKPYSSFCDYAYVWGGGKGGGRFLFVRGNVVGDVSVHVRNTDGHDMVLSLARILSRKIDAVLAGRPEPVPILPKALN